jgi:nucleoside phosphorylase
VRLSRRLLPIVLAALTLQSGVALADSGGGSGSVTCGSRLLVLSAFPGEIDGLITKARILDTVVAESRTFFLGDLEGNEVALALTGIGLVNAEQTATAAFKALKCGGRSDIAGVVFSGVSGGKTNIGDVTVASRWTMDDGKTWTKVSPAMLATARRVAGTVKLAQQTPAGDPACVGIDPDTFGTVDVSEGPKVIVGGDGKSTDPFGGRRLPCFPAGGDTFGCEPCRAGEHQAPDLERFATGIVPFIDPSFFTDYFANPPPADSTYTAEDMETAAVAKVAVANHVPFIAFRALSDGRGDPLMLPGFPFQFFYYRQIAADNAATTTLAFLKAWSSRSSGTGRRA